MAGDFVHRLRFLRTLPSKVPILVQRELFPWFPGEFERLFLKRRRYIMDFDDAFQVWYRPFPLLRRKFEILIRDAFEVHAGNEFLAEESRKFNPRVKVIPTVLNPDEYRKRSGRTDPAKLVVGWIGAPLSKGYLESFLPVLESVREVPIELRCMGAGKPFKTTLPQSHSRWTSQAEKDFCSQLDVGIMPLVDEPFSEGKCGFKLLQYMSAGVATIASKSRANSRILDSGRCGLLVSSEKDWRDAFKALHETPGLLERLGAFGLQRVQQEYSLSKWAPTWVDAVRRLVSGGSPD